MSHLLAKVGAGDSEPHPFIDEFITTIEEDNGICYTHPQHLPGVSQDGSVAHFFFHKAVKAYSSGGRKRRRLFDQDFGELRWHKTGKTRRIFLDGIQKGCKKIMVLYTTPSNGEKAEKTNWIVHQYHLGREEDEKEGEYVVSKIFYQQQQPVKLGKKDDKDVPETSGEASIARVVDPVTPNFVTPELPCDKKQCSDVNQEQESQQEPQHISEILPNVHQWLLDTQNDREECSNVNQEQESHHMNQEQEPHQMNQEQEPHHFSQILPNIPQWLLDSPDDHGELPNIDQLMVESQNIEGIDDIDLSLNLFSSQQFAGESPFMFHFLPSQSPKRNVDQPSLSGSAHLGEQSQKDIEECQNPNFDTTKNNVGECQNLDPDTGNVNLDPQPFMNVKSVPALHVMKLKRVLVRDN
ncbi:hypothetical protein TSUD_39980 [Trifolium subterraneum]|uniref:NAC domain-containing protein n=1 Tax=Trifolium subterraneum TaxID=3900 RepID=A0A2Z6MWT7_TRISU|nr:hypothetical protein TSUD_39980 [Trifolium subterraneum]